jgi:hypothetical protein
MHEDLRTLLANPSVYPVELTLTSGDTIKIPHPDWVHFPSKMKDIVYFPPEQEGAVFELIDPELVTKVRAKSKRRVA